MPMQAHVQSIVRPKNAAATRDAILDAARTRFLGESYDNVGLRDIAGDAGVDVALIGRYFGSKEKLFDEVVEKGDCIPFPDGIQPAELPALLTRLFAEHDHAEHREHAEQLLIILRSASSPVASRIARDSMRKDVLEPLAARLRGDAPEARASLAMAVWMGVTILQSIMAIEPLCNDKCDFVNAKLVALFEAALSEV